MGKIVPRAIGRRERNKLDKLQRITDAAAMLFRTKGYEKTTTQAIADAADVGSGTLFLYARTKEDLIVAVMARDVAKTLEKALTSMPRTASAVAKALHIYTRLLRFHAKEKVLTRHFVRECSCSRQADPPPDQVKLERAVIGAIAAVLKTDQEAGRMRRDLSTDEVANNFHALYWRKLLLLLSGAVSLEQSIHELKRGFSMFCQGIESTPARSAARA
jgi:TetR/AcrR family transcriptional regulator, cholesterol catabolism regulator